MGRQLLGQESRCQCHQNILSMEVSIYLAFATLLIKYISILDQCSWRGGNCYGQQVLEFTLFFSQNCFHLFQWKIIPDTVGPMATITDSLFSLIIFIYVMITFLYLFYGFCWIDAPKKTEAEIEEENKLVRDSPKRCGRLARIARLTRIAWIARHQI